MTTDAKIVLRDVRKSFALKNEEFVALDGVSLGIADNEFVTVVGPSGCGKSTLLNSSPTPCPRRSPAG